MIKLVRAMLLLIAPLAWGTAAHAALVTYDYTGEVRIVNDSVAANSSIRVGDAFTGSFTLDTGVPDEVADIRRGVYPGFLSGRTTIGALTFTSTGGYYGVTDRLGVNEGKGDEVTLSASNVDVTGIGLTSFMEGVSSIAFIFHNRTDDFLTSDALPDLVDFFDAVLPLTVDGRIVFRSGGSSGSLFLRMDSISLRESGNAVPEPGSLALMALALVGLAARRRVAARSDGRANGPVVTLPR